MNTGLLWAVQKGADVAVEVRRAVRRYVERMGGQPGRIIAAPGITTEPTVADLPITVKAGLTPGCILLTKGDENA